MFTLGTGGTLDKTKYSRQPAYSFGLKSDKNQIKSTTPGMFTN